MSNLKSILHGKLFFILCALIFRGLLDVSYLVFVNPLFSYAGFTIDVTFSAYIFSWFLFLITCIYTPHLFMKVSDYFLCSFSLAILAPLSSLYGLSDLDEFPLLVTFISFLVIQFIVKLKLPFKIKIPVLRGGPLVAKGGALISIFFLIGWYFYSGAWQYFNLDFSKVYEYRELSAKAANIGLLAYFNNWVYQIFSIFVLAWMLHERRFFMFSVFLLIQIFFFGVSGHKSLFFYPILVLSIWFYFRRYHALSIIPIGFCVIVVITLLTYVLFDQIMPASMFIRRVFYVPAYLTYQYFDFFSVNQFVIWSNSILSNFISYPYNESLVVLIGNYEGSGAAANNGYVASGYAHLGLMGVGLYTIIFSILIRLIDVFSSKTMPAWFALAITIVPLRAALISSDLFTTLLTHGLIISLILLYLNRQYSK